MLCINIWHMCVITVWRLQLNLFINNNGELAIGFAVPQYMLHNLSPLWKDIDICLSTCYVITHITSTYFAFEIYVFNRQLLRIITFMFLSTASEIRVERKCYKRFSSECSWIQVLCMGPLQVCWQHYTEFWRWK